MHWTPNSACVLIVLLYSLDIRLISVLAGRSGKYIPFLQEEMQLRQRQRHRLRVFSEDTPTRQWKADKLISRNEPEEKHGKRTVLDYLKYEAGGDGLNVTWAHNVNSRPALGRALSGFFDGVSAIVEGDVFLKHQSSYTPMMLIPPLAEDAVKFKDWLIEVSQLDNIIKINLRTTDVIKPALQYLFTAKDSFKGPLIVHSNIGVMPGSLEIPVDAGVLTTEIQNALLEATIGVGWADGVMPIDDESGDAALTKYTWRIIFDMLEYTYELRQPVLFSVRAKYATFSVYELLWLLSVRDNYALNIFCADKDTVGDWTGLAALRQHGPRDRIIYDFTDGQRDEFMEKLAQMKQIDIDPPVFEPTLWRVVHFINPTALLSTITVGSRGAAFLGWPTAFLLSHVRARPGRTQTITGRLLFVPKRSHERVYAAEESGLSIFLLNSVDDMPSPVIRGGIRAFIGSTGHVSLQNRQERRPSYRHRRKHHNDTSPNMDHASYSRANPYAYISPSRSSGPFTASRLPAYECYGFRLVDEQRRIRLTVFLSRCVGGSEPFPKSYWSRTISLNVPRPDIGQSRFVVVQKTGDSSTDVFVENLYHRNGALPIFKCQQTFAFVMLTILWKTLAFNDP